MGMFVHAEEQIIDVSLEDGTIVQCYLEENYDSIQYLAMPLGSAVPPFEAVYDPKIRGFVKKKESK